MGFRHMILQLVTPTCEANSRSQTRQAAFSVAGDGLEKFRRLALIADASGLLYHEIATLPSVDQAKLVLARAEHWYECYNARYIVLIFEWNNHLGKVVTLANESGDRGERFAEQKRLHAEGDLDALVAQLAPRARTCAAVMKAVRALVAEEELPFTLVCKVALCESDGQLMFYAHNLAALARLFGCTADDFDAVGMISSDTDQVILYPGVQHTVVWGKTQLSQDFGVDIGWFLRTLGLLPQEFAIARLATVSDHSRDTLVSAGVTTRCMPLSGINLQTSAQAAKGCLRFEAGGELDLDASLREYLRQVGKLKPSAVAKLDKPAVLSRLKQSYLDSYVRQPALDCVLGTLYLNPCDAGDTRVLNDVLLWELPLADAATLISLSNGELEPCVIDGSFGLRPVLARVEPTRAGHWRLRQRLEELRAGAEPGSTEAELDEYEFITSRQMFKRGGELDQALELINFCYTAHTMREQMSLKTAGARQFLRLLDAGDESGALEVLGAHAGADVLDRPALPRNEFTDIIVADELARGSRFSVALAWAGCPFKAQTVYISYKLHGNNVRLLLAFHRDKQLEKARALLSRHLPQGWQDVDAFCKLEYDSLFSNAGLLAELLRIFRVEYSTVDTFRRAYNFGVNFVRELLRRGAKGDKAGAIAIMEERFTACGKPKSFEFDAIELENMYIPGGTLHAALEAKGFDPDVVMRDSRELLRAAKPAPAGCAVSRAVVRDGRSTRLVLGTLQQPVAPEARVLAAAASPLATALGAPTHPRASQVAPVPVAARRSDVPPPLERVAPTASAQRSRRGVVVAAAPASSRAAPHGQASMQAQAQAQLWPQVHGQPKPAAAKPPPPPPPQPQPHPQRQPQLLSQAWPLLAGPPAASRAAAAALASSSAVPQPQPPSQPLPPPSSEAPAAGHVSLKVKLHVCPPQPQPQSPPASPAEAPPAECAQPPPRAAATSPPRAPHPSAAELQLALLPSAAAQRRGIAAQQPQRLLPLLPEQRNQLGPAASALYEAAARRMLAVQHDPEAIQVVVDHAVALAVREGWVLAASPTPPRARSPAAAALAWSPPQLRLPPPAAATAAQLAPAQQTLSLEPTAALPPPQRLLALLPADRALLGPALSGLYESAAARMVQLQHDSQAVQLVLNHAASLGEQHVARETALLGAAGAGAAAPGAPPPPRVPPPLRAGGRSAAARAMPPPPGAPALAADPSEDSEESDDAAEADTQATTRFEHDSNTWGGGEHHRTAQPQMRRSGRRGPAMRGLSERR